MTNLSPLYFGRTLQFIRVKSVERSVHLWHYSLSIRGFAKLIFTAVFRSFTENKNRNFLCAAISKQQMNLTKF